jgi:hypothetical protein
MISEQQKEAVARLTRANLMHGDIAGLWATRTAVDTIRLDEGYLERLAASRAAEHNAPSDSIAMMTQGQAIRAELAITSRTLKLIIQCIGTDVFLARGLDRDEAEGCLADTLDELEDGRVDEEQPID